MDAKTITLKALVDKVKNKIIYVESEGDFVDVLFSFLTMPLGTIIRLTRNRPPIIEVGCINNLYASVENLDARYLRTEACKTMLLKPQSAAAEHCKSLKVQIDDTDSGKYFLCGDPICRHKLKCHYNDNPCLCGRSMIRVHNEVTPVSQLGFVSDIAQFVISDDLEVQPTSSVFLVSLLAKHGDGVQDFSSLEERTFQIGADEVLNLLKFSWVSRTPLTDVLLQNNTTREVSIEYIGQVGFVKHEATDVPSVQNDSKISVKLLISKSKRIVCYAEGEEDFVDLLFSFLSVPLGHVFKEPQSACPNGSLRNLYKSVHDLDTEKSLISKAKKDILCNLKLAKWFGFSGHLLGLEEEAGSKNLQNPSSSNGVCTNNPLVSSYMGCYSSHSSQMNVKQTSLSFGREVRSTNYTPSYGSQMDPTVPIIGATNVTYFPHFIEMDPKVPNAEATNSGKGFTKKPAMFRVTDDLNVTPTSLSSALSILTKLQVSVADLEERTVLMGKEEALSLLFAAFNNSSCALTEAFLPKRQAQSTKRKR